MSNQFNKQNLFSCIYMPNIEEEVPAQPPLGANISTKRISRTFPSS